MIYFNIINDEGPVKIFQPTKHPSTVPCQAVPPGGVGESMASATLPSLSDSSFLVGQIGGNS